MRIAIEAGDVSVSDDVLSEVDRAVSARVGASSAFAGARDLRLRLRHTKNALLCIAAVGFAGGGLVTSTAEGTSPFEAIVGALEDLPVRMDRLDDARRRTVASPAAEHAAIRAELTRMLDRQG
jgi:hypothetical protein